MIRSKEDSPIPAGFAEAVVASSDWQRLLAHLHQPGADPKQKVIYPTVNDLGQPVLALVLRDRCTADEVLPSILQDFLPPTIHCDMSRGDDWGSYANLKIPLGDRIELQAYVTMASYGDGIQSTFEKLGYRRHNWVDIIYGQGDYILIQESSP